MVSFCFGEPSSFGLAPLSADSCSGRVQTLPFRHHVRARRKSESPQKLLQRLKACLGPELAKEKFSSALPSPRRYAPLGQLGVVPPSGHCPLHPSERAKSVFLTGTAGNRNSSFPVALPTEKRPFLPAVCRRKGSLRDLPSCLRASVSRHLHGQ